MKTAIFPGSFDPVTTGHLDLIKRASCMFDRLIVAILVNSAKVPFCTLEERVEMLKSVTGDMDNVTIETFDGLLADFVDKMHADVIVRGIRNSVDFEYELPLAQANYKLNEKADTVFLATSPEYSYVSSSAVRELMRYNANIDNLVPKAVKDILIKK